MTTSTNALNIRRVLGRSEWSTPAPFGPDGWSFTRLTGEGSVIVSCADFGGDEWVHASIARTDRMPDYGELKLLHAAVFGDGWAYQVFAPPSDHVNIHRFALHLWGKLDGSPALPDFADGGGSI
jgi:hypothetical protein